MKAAIYVRVSTEKQNYESQIGELREYCARQKWVNVTEYEDKISGSKFTRTGLYQLMTEVRKGKVDVIVCYKLDRIGRSLAHLAQLCAELEKHKCALVCTSQGIDTTENNAAGRLQLGVLMAVAAFERENTIERVNAGLKAARARGVRLGPKPKNDKHKGAVAALVADGLGVREIARRLNLPVGSTHKLVSLVRPSPLVTQEAVVEPQEPSGAIAQPVA